MEDTAPLRQILQRYSFPLGNNLLHSYHELKTLDIDQDFIYVLLKSFEDDSAFSSRDYDKFTLNTVIDYIRRTHRLYLTKKLGEIEQSIGILSKDNEGRHPLLMILNRFYSQYQEDLTNHIRAEEAYLLPYIDYLLKAELGNVEAIAFKTNARKFALQDFIEGHNDTEEDLSDVRSCILEYNPPVTNQTPYRILITQLEMFERDLRVHALIEDHVLVPRAQELETKLHEKFKQG